MERIFYAMIEGAITYPALFADGIKKAAVEPLLWEIVDTFLARYKNESMMT